jgi:hypothetical protein
LIAQREHGDEVFVRRVPFDLYHGLLEGLCIGVGEGSALGGTYGLAEATTCEFVPGGKPKR